MNKCGNVNNIPAYNADNIPACNTDNSFVYNADNIPVYADERIDDLQFKGMKIIQSENAFRFGTDSVLLAGFSNPSKSEKCIDLGAGTGVLSILLNARTGCRMTCAEIDSEQCGRMERSVIMNGQQNEIEILNIDYIKEKKQLGAGKFDSAVCNPPYFKESGGIVSKNAEATHDISANIFEITQAAAYLLKFGGKLFICFPANALAELFAALEKAKTEPKRLRFVASNPDSRPYLALVEAKKGGKRGLIVEKTLVIHTENGNYTDEVKKIYHEQ